MIPLRDNLPTRYPPVVTLLLIGLNTYAFLKVFLLGAYAGQRYLLYYGLIPCSLTGSCQVLGRAFSPEATLVSSMFVHAGFFHFAGNMLYLWIFGNNVEDAMGKVRFPIFYLACGLAAACGADPPQPDVADPDGRGQWGDLRCARGLPVAVSACAGPDPDSAGAPVPPGRDSGRVRAWDFGSWSRS